MAVAQGTFLLLLVSTGILCSSLPPSVCPESCTCQRAPLLNCSSSDLSYVPQPIQDFVSELDLSHNLLDSVTLRWPHRNLRNLWLGNNTITHLSLCIEKSLPSQSASGGHLHPFRPWSRGRCISWAPTLQLLSVERNELVQFPEGLEGSASLQVLELSFNRISTLQPGDLRHLRQLKELHLQHNLITSLHPQMFQDLLHLRVLNLSFNMLTSLHPWMYLSLRNIGANVRLAGNRWQCDCSMRSLRRRMAHDSSRDLQVWSMVCVFPSNLSGKDLLQLEEGDLNCFSTENKPDRHQDVTVYSGSEILLSCSAQDSIWWTSSGKAPVSQTKADLLISDVTERDTGLYVCMSEENEVVSVYNLKISRSEGAERKTRSLSRTSQHLIPQNTPKKISGERNNRATLSDLALAVCLSVFITFLVAFILGVLARPCIDVLWKKVTNKKSPSVSSIEQRQYENEAYSSGEEPEEIITNRERRVTFSTIDFRGDGNVQYYDTVASGDQENINNDAVIECETTKAEEENHSAGDSGSEISLHQSSPGDNLKDSRDLSGITNAGGSIKMEFEHTQDPNELEERKSLSSPSNSSLSVRDHTTLKSSLQAEDSLQQRDDFSTSRKVELPQIAIEEKNEIPGFSSEPFADCSSPTDNTNPTDSNLWQENEEQFEFSDSVRSTSTRSSSVFGSFNGPKLIVVSTANKQKGDDTSSSSSYVSEDEPTQYTVNSDQEWKEVNIKRNNKKSLVNNSCLKQEAGYEQQVVRAAVSKSLDMSASSSNESEEEMTDPNVKDKKCKLPPLNSSSSDESSAGTMNFSKKQKQKQCKMHMARLPFQESQKTVSHDQDTQWPGLDLEHTPHIKRRLDIKAPSPDSDSSSNSSSEDETADYTVKQRPARVDNAELQKSEKFTHDPNEGWLSLDLEHIPRIKRRLDIKAPPLDSESSSSSDSEDETTNPIKKQEQEEIHMAMLPNKISQTISHDPERQWPLLDLEYTRHVKRRLDIKAPSPDSDSSSNSSSEDETADYTVKQRPARVDNAELQKSEKVTHDPDEQWTALDLEHIPRIKRHLDIKAPSPDSDSSSSSDSEDEMADYTVKQRPARVDNAELQKSEKVTHDTDEQWSALDLEHIPRIKRRLDIKAPSPDSDSSSSSSSEDETADYTVKQRPARVDNAELQKSEKVTHDTDEQWSALDLEHIPRIKRRLDIKAPSPDSDSSSNSSSEDEAADYTVKQRPARVNNAEQQKSEKVTHDPDEQWSALDLEHIPRIKRRLDIKVLSLPVASASHSKIVEETLVQIKNHEQGEENVSKFPFQQLEAESHHPDIQWPVLDLKHTTHIKRRLDIKAPPLDSESSSSSDSEDETTNPIKKQEQEEIHMAMLPNKISQTISHDPERQWPLLDLEYTRHVKRRLDIKAPSPDSDSSSSSSSEDETADYTVKQRPARVDNAELQKSEKVTHDPDEQWSALDLEHIPRIKRRLDIKAPSPDSDSSSSSDSEDEMADYTVKQRPARVDNAELQKSEKVTHDPDEQWSALDLEHIPRTKRRLDIKVLSLPVASASHSKIVEETLVQIKNHEQGEENVSKFPFQQLEAESHHPDIQWPVLDLKHTTHIKRRLDIKAPPLDSESSSSSDSEDETTNPIKKQEQEEIHMAMLPNKISQTISHDPERQWPLLDLEYTRHVKRRLDIKAPSPDSDSSSSSSSEDETADYTVKQRPARVDNAELQKSEKVTHDTDEQWSALDLEHIPRIKRRLDIKAPPLDSESSSSSDSEDETTNPIKKQEQEEIHMAMLPNKISQTISHDPERQWPLLDLEYTRHVKRRLDIKAPSPDSDSSSSSSSEDETADYTVKQRPARVDNAELQKSEKVTHDPDEQWSALDLEHIPRIKRRLDIKAPSPDSDSSSSSDSEDEMADYTVKQRPSRVDNAELQKSEKVTHDPDEQWSALDLEHIPRTKRRLDIKVLSLPVASASHSKIVEETLVQIKNHEQGEENVSKFPFQQLEAESHHPDIQWPVLDLKHTTHIKRGLDIKAPPLDSESSSSSDSEDETTNPIKKQEQEEIHMAMLPNKISQTISHDPERQWPLLDLEYTRHVKRRLDIKAPSPNSDSSSSSSSEDEAADYTVKQRPARLDNAELQKSEKVTHDTDEQWSALDLEHIPRIKRRLDIKAPPLDSESSSSSDSEDETTNPIKKQEQEEIHMAMLPNKISQTISHDPERQWPLLDLEYTRHVKRRLDIKAPSPDSESSSSSSEDETTHLRPGEVHISKVPLQKSQTLSHDSEILWPAVDLVNISHIKRHLDIKAPSSPPDLLSFGSTNHTVKEKMEESKFIKNKINLITGEQALHPRWPQLGLPHVKRRLDIKTHSFPNESFSQTDESDSGTTDLHVKMESERIDERIKTQRGAKLDKSVPSAKRRLNIKAPPQPTDTCSSTSDSESLSSHTVKSRNKVDVGITKPPSPQADLVLSSVSVDTQWSGSNSSGSESEGDNRDHKVKVEMGISAISEASDKELIRFPKTPGINISHNPKTNDAVLSHDLKHKPTTDNISTTPEINPELQSQWATMNLGISRFRRRLEITSHLPPNLPTSPPPDSSLNNNSETGRKSILLQRSSSSSNSEFEITDHSVSDLSFDVRNFKRHLKVPSSEPNNSPFSFSESKNEMTEYTVQESRHASNMPVMAEKDSGITHYKRLIIKSSLQSQTVDHAEKATVAQDGLFHPSRVLNKFDNSRVSTDEILKAASEHRMERKGLTALKIMSSERQKWDKGNGNYMDKGASPYNDQGPQHNNSRFEENITSLAKSRKSRTPSPSVNVGGEADLLYTIPSYRRHNFGDVEPQEPPPSIPTTPPPDETFWHT